MTSIVDAEHQFGLLTMLLDLARSQHLALQDREFTRVERLMSERIEIMSRIQDLQLGSEPLPENVVHLQTEFSIGHEVDTATATDMAIRLILDQDSINERLIVRTLSTSVDAG